MRAPCHLRSTRRSPRPWTAMTLSSPFVQANRSPKRCWTSPNTIRTTRTSRPKCSPTPATRSATCWPSETRSTFCRRSSWRTNRGIARPAPAAALNQVRWNVVAAELTTLATTEKLFFTALYQRDLRDLAQRAATLNEELAADVERRFKVGARQARGRHQPPAFRCGKAKSKRPSPRRTTNSRSWPWNGN